MPRTALFKLLVLGALGASLAGAVLYLDRFNQNLAEFLGWIDGLGYVGLAVFAGVYAVATVLFIPGILLTLAGGFVFGPLWGAVGVSFGSTAGAAAAFLLGRTLLRATIERKVSESPRFSAIDQAIGRHGAKIVLLVRLSPVFPFNLMNYAFGLTSIRFWPYVLASWIGMLPATVIYTYLGSAVGSLAEILSGRYERGAAHIFILGVGLVAAVTVTVLITRIAHNALRQDMQDM